MAKNQCQTNTGSTLPCIQVELNKNLTHHALLDSGASVNLINKDTFDALMELNLIKIYEEKPIVCHAANQSKIEIVGTCVIKIKILDFSWKTKFLVANTLNWGMILGYQFIRETGMVLDLSNNEGYFKFNTTKVFKVVSTVSAGKINCSIEDRTEDLFIGTMAASAKVHQLVDQFSDLFSDRVGLVKNFQIDLKVVDPTPVRLKPYPMSPPKIKIMREIIDQLLEQGVIEKAHSEYNSPSFIIPKPGSSEYRLVINYSKLNEKLEKLNWPVGDVQSTFHHLTDSAYYTTLDLTSAYHQLEISPRSRHLTNFSTPFGCFNYRRLPFGIHAGSFGLCSAIDGILGDLKYKICTNFLDDLIIYSPDLETHYNDLQTVFKRLRDNGITINPKKSRFAFTEISYLGHIISKNKIKIDPERTVRITECEPPKNVKALVRFLASVQYYSRYIPNFAVVCAPLAKLRKKNAKWVWDHQCEEAFQKLKEAITNPPILAMANYDKTMYLNTDASQLGTGACLGQVDDNGVMLPIAYFSKRFNDNEVNYSVYEKEALAAIWAIEKFKPFLEHRPFVLRTDNSALSFVLSQKQKLGRLGRYSERLLALPFTTEFVPGHQNQMADFLSRMFERESGNNNGGKNICGEEIVSQNKPEKKQRCVNKKGNKRSGVKQKRENSEVVLNNIKHCPEAFQSIGDFQKRDPETSFILNQLEQGQRVDNYSMSRGILFFQPKFNVTPKIVVPTNVKDMIFNYYHNEPISGHPGVKRTMERIKRYFFWHNMRREISERVRGCTVCQRSKAAQKKFAGDLISHEPKFVMQKIYCDIMGPLVKSSKQNEYVLVLTEAVSRYTWLIPLRVAKSLPIIEKIKTVIFQNFGQCEFLVTDNGRQFVSKAFRNFTFAHGIKHVKLIPYRPNPNYAERYIKNLKALLIAYYNDQHTKWDSDLYNLQICLNTAKNENTGFSAFELLMGYEPANTLSNLWNLRDICEADQLSTEAREKFKTAIETHKAKLVQARKRAIYQDGKKHPFVVGSTVYLQSHHLSSKVKKQMAKLFYRYDGPFTIKLFLSEVSCILQHQIHLEDIRRCHIHQLKLG